MSFRYILSASRVHDVVFRVAVLAGAVAFGLWWDSISAGLFGCFLLSFLAGIHKALRNIVTSLRLQRDGTIRASASQWDFEIDARSIEHLLAWVKGEASLTEESAKEYCSVLLDIVAARRRVSA